MINLSIFYFFFVDYIQEKKSCPHTALSFVIADSSVSVSLSVEK